MPVQAIVGAQWGDEGKGKITDLLAQEADIVIRFGGGANAGHTVVNDLGKFALHAVPSGIFNPDAIALIGTGAVVDFDYLQGEVKSLRDGGIDISGLRISNRAHVVMPYHIELDRLGDQARGKQAIGTTGRGIGPAYVDKVDRVGIQVGDLLDPDVLCRKLEQVLPARNRRLTEEFGAQPFRLDELVERAAGWRAEFSGHIVDQVALLSAALEGDQRILLEGQLGALRDLDWGTYPYVTSSTAIAGGGGVGGGIPPMLIDSVIGVVKAYTSAVGTGPVPAELHGEEADALRDRGEEIGVTTGRPRRVGWFDAVATRYACMLNRFSGVAVTKLDVLDGMPTLKICTAYRDADMRYSTLPPTHVMERVTPEYEEMPGWPGSTRDARSWQELPAEARAYVERLGELIGAEIQMVSVGPGRDETILLR